VRLEATRTFLVDFRIQSSKKATTIAIYEPNRPKTGGPCCILPCVLLDKGACKDYLRDVAAG